MSNIKRVATQPTKHDCEQSSICKVTSATSFFLALNARVYAYWASCISLTFEWVLCSRPAFSRAALSTPLLQSTVQHRNIFMSKRTKSPPNTRRREDSKTAWIIHHDMAAVGDSKATYVLAKFSFAGQHMLVWIDFVATIVDVKESSAWDSLLRKLFRGISLCNRKKPWPV